MFKNKTNCCFQMTRPIRILGGYYVRLSGISLSLHSRINRYLLHPFVHLTSVYFSLLPYLHLSHHSQKKFSTFKDVCDQTVLSHSVVKL